jgi:hypothetical protein
MDLRSETLGMPLRKQAWEKKETGRDASATKTEGEEELIRVRRRRDRRLGGGR